MKTRLSFIALILCTLFFACKKNDLQIQDSNKVSASETSNSKFDSRFDTRYSAGNSGSASAGGSQFYDIPSNMTFNCTNLPANRPFYIIAGMIQENANDYSVLIEYEGNPNYLGNDVIDEMRWYYCIKYRSNDDTGNFGPCNAELYNKDNLLITIPKTIDNDDVKIEISGTCNATNGNEYTFGFHHIIDQTPGLPETYNLVVTEGNSIYCDCPLCSVTYTLVLP